MSFGRRVSAAVILTAALLAPQTSWARDCPSLLSGHLFQIGDTLELGAEFRAFYFGVSVGEGLPTSLDPLEHPYEFPWENNVFMGLRTLLYWYPADGLTIGIEDELRFRWPGWDSHAIPGLDHRPVQLFIEYEWSSFRVTGGLQSFAFGTAAVLDQRFLGLSAEYEHDVFSIELLGGMTTRHLMRNAANSMWMSYMADTNGWKFTSQSLPENFAAGMVFSLRCVIRPFRLQLLYLYSHTSYDHLRSHAVSLHFAGPIWRPYISFVLEPLVLIDHQGHGLPGVVAEVRARFGRSGNVPTLTVGGASSILHNVPGRDDDPDDERRMSAVYENLSLGMIRRFNLRQGHIFFTRANWQINDYVGIFAGYYMNFNGEELDDDPEGVSIVDELDVGVALQVNDLYRLSIAYVGMDVAGDPISSHAVYAEARIIIGQ